MTAIPAFVQADSAWVSKTLYDGTDVLFMPGTRIGADAVGNWTLLDADGHPTAYRMPHGGHYFDDQSFDRGDGIDPDDFAPVDDIPDAHLQLLADYTKRQYEETDYALLGWGYGVCFLGLSLITDRRSNVTMGQPSDWMMMLMTEPETCHAMMDRSVEASIKCLSLVKEAVGDRCFAWGIAADDSGTQRGEFINPDLWAAMIKPHYTKLCDWIHRNTRWKTFFHCCGSVYHLIPHFIEAGIDILNPIQTSAANMDPAALKAEFGRQIVLWGGGCDTQTVLGMATPAEVREHVRQRIAAFAPGGGYVFNQVHNIQADVPAENIIAMFDAAYEFGGY
jgi:uroporphyrinogen-III decarboxylase